MGALFTFLVVAAAAVWLSRRRASSGGDGDGGGSSPGLHRPGSGGRACRVVIRDGRVENVEGRIPRAMLSAFEDIAAHAGVTGEVVLTRDAGLEFSGDIPPGVRQQFRNAYVVSVNVH